MNRINSILQVILLVIVPLISTIGQSTTYSLTLSNNTIDLPIISYPDLFYSQFHPGIEATYSKQLNKDSKNKFYLNGNIGYYYHQFVQSLVKIYPTVSYERAINKRLDINLGLGAGYGLSFEGDNAFTLQDNGSYKNKSFLGARSQYLIAFELATAFALAKDKLNSPELLIQFKSFMQGTYVKSYVPLLPINSVNIGVRFPLQNIEQ